MGGRVGRPEMKQVANQDASNVADADFDEAPNVAEFVDTAVMRLFSLSAPGFGRRQSPCLGYTHIYRHTHTHTQSDSLRQAR